MESYEYGDYYFSKKQKRKKRSENWTAEMRQILHNLVQQHTAIVDSKSNSNIAIQAKKRVWQEMSVAMTHWGYNIKPKRLKEAWGRIKSCSRSTKLPSRETITQESMSSDMNTSESTFQPADYMELTIKEESCQQQNSEIKGKLGNNADLKDYQALGYKFNALTHWEQQSNDQKRFIEHKIAAIEEERANMNAKHQLQITYEQKRINFLESELAARTTLYKERSETQKLLQMYLKKKLSDSKVHKSNNRRVSF